MAVPPHFTTMNLSARFILNHTLTDSGALEELLLKQGISDPELRRAITHGVLSFNHYKDDDGDERIWVAQELDGRSEKISHTDHPLDWRDRAQNDPLFGPVVRRIRRTKTHGLEPQFLRRGWTPDTLKYGVLHSHYVCARGDIRAWTTVETWGIEEIEGERRFARHVRICEPDEKSHLEARLVYDYVEALV
ncbi:hypothetical protein C8R44DRAFT_680270 [Mycena epipterygia]|nr:hypothetical protein C8R44DRAFT_680270 [Mycena epipterygia]